MKGKLYSTSLLFIGLLLFSPVGIYNTVSAEPGDFNDPIPIYLDTPLTGSIAEGQETYYNFSSSTNAWYRVTLNKLDNADFGVDLDVYPWAYDYENGYFGYYREHDYQVTSVFGNYSGNVAIALYGWWDAGNYNLSISEIPAPEHFSQETAKQASLGTNTGNLVEGVNFFFSFEMQATNWYYFQLSSNTTEFFDVSMYVYDEYYYEYHYGYNGELVIGDIDGLVFIEVNSYEYSGYFELFINETDPLEHYNEETAKPASLGDNSGNLAYTTFQFYFSFTMAPDQWYSFAITSPDNSELYYYFDLNVYPDYYTSSDSFNELWVDSNEVWAGGHSGAVYVTVASWEYIGDFILTITEIETPSMLTQFAYSDELETGNIYEWQTSTTATGVFQNIFDNEDNVDDFFVDGAMVELEVLGDQRVFDNMGDAFWFYIDSETLAQVFQFTVNGNPLEYWDNTFLLPTEYIFEDGTTKSLLETIGEPYSPVSGLSPVEDEGLEVTTSGDELRLYADLTELFNSGEMGDEFGTFTKFIFELRYDMSTGLLTFFGYDVETDQGTLLLEVNLLTDLPGDDTGLSDPFGLDLPLPILPIGLALLAIPIIRRRK